MMDTRSGTDRLKVVGGTVIVATAFAIMMPGVIDYISRIGRVLLLVLAAVSIALVVVVVRHKVLAARKAAAEGEPGGADASRPAERESSGGDEAAESTERI